MTFWHCNTGLREVAGGFRASHHGANLLGAFLVRHERRLDHPDDRPSVHSLGRDDRDLELGQIRRRALQCQLEAMVLRERSVLDLIVETAPLLRVRTGSFGESRSESRYTDRRWQVSHWGVVRPD